MDLLSRVRDIVDMEILAIKSIPFDRSIAEAVNKIFDCDGKIILTGIGKAGIIARKISATLSSTGTPSLFMHPGESQHGDLGMIDNNDIIIALSNSGKTREVVETIMLSKNLGISCVIAITSSCNSTLSRLSDITIQTGAIKEAGPFGMAPTCSTTVMTVIGDAIAILLMEKREFTKEEYLMRHHGGYIGSKLRNEIEEYEDI